MPAELIAVLRAAPAVTAPALLGPTLETLQRLRADSEVQLAAIVHLTPGLRERLPADTLKKASGLALLLDGLRAAEQVWSLHAQREGRGNAEGLRRLLLAIIRDLRVVLILLSVQLARLRAAGKSPREEQIALAELTADIHAPLANRLGIWQLKWELEDLAFRYLQPETYQRIAKLLDEKRTGRERFIEEAKQKIRDTLAEAGIHADVAGRPKHIFSIWKKMTRKGVPFSELYDIRAVRVLVDDVADCYAALGLVHQMWTPIASEFDDYIAQPKGNDYRSLHTALVDPEGRTLEVQIRTHQMHEHAELGVAAHWRYKEGGKAEASFERKVAWMRQLLEGREGDDENALLAGFNTALIEDRVYLLTPRGEVIDLPQNATVLDFAYAVHTEVGHRCRGAKVNGRIVPLDFRPATGDRVEIITSKTGEPRRDWLLAANGFLATGRARDKVRAWFHKLDRARNLQAGKDLLEKELRRVAMLNADLAPVLEKLRVDSLDDLHVALALGDIGPSQVSRTLHDHAQALLLAAQPAKPVAAAKPVARSRPPTDGSRFTVEGVGNLLVQLARCCQPVPGDAIIGYLTRGRGVSIHRLSCASGQRLVATQPERQLPVNWGQAASSRYEVNVLVRAYDRKWLLKDLTNVIAQAEINILSMSSRADEARGLAEIKLVLKVSDYEQLSELLGKLDAVPGVQDARRLG
ncbi:RelA/SpoT family protein [Arenimonas oryziterrae]|uniref:RelA/SpoT family protein n=1 Tax=Arenimonas oryziterrae TaxID=498055 RepID=UPI001FE1ED3C|nr:bifunctional (p)ppGpp synthetase/guanosine-3',5'-bis(diphosphate) 3'-pyrophosphohydrolase [Arenimonas oryziterrae]